MRIALSVVFVVVSVASAQAQQIRPKACRYVVDVEHRTVAVTTQPKVGCEYGGKILMTVNNLDDAKYRLHIGNFKFDANDPTRCTAPTSPASEVPINGNDGGGRFTFNLTSENTHTKKKKIKALGAKSSECFKFDILLYSAGGGELLFTLDPELSITEPQPPPVKGPGL